MSRVLLEYPRKELPLVLRKEQAVQIWSDAAEFGFLSNRQPVIQHAVGKEVLDLIELLYKSKNRKQSDAISHDFGQNVFTHIIRN